MANQYVNKVEYGSDTLIDLTSDTVTASTLLSGYTAHDRSGAPIVGVAVSGGYTVNFSTTNPDLYGATITIKQGSTVIGTVAFDNTGSASYTLSNPGTYTWSVTLDGETYTDTFAVSAPEVYIETTFVYRDWLVAGGLNPSDYADLPAVLADEEAVRQLMTIHAAVDYLASFDSTDASVVTILNDNYAAKWISLTDYAMDTLEAAYGTLMGTIGKYGYGEWGITDATTTPPTWGALGNVPVMTSNTAPYGTASASSENSPAYLAFDGVTGTSDGWLPTSGATNNYLQYEFTNPVCAKKVTAEFYIAYSNPARTFTVKASNDGFVSDTHDVGTFSLAAGSTSQTISVTADLSTDGFYKYYRIFCADSIYASGAWYIKTEALQFYGRALKVSVPKMSGNTTPYGEAICSTVYSSSYAAFKAFDNDASTEWQTSLAATNNYIGYKFTSPVCIRHIIGKLHLIVSSATQERVYKIQGSNDGFTSDVHDIDTITVAGGITSSQTITIDKAFDNDNAYADYRLFCAEAIYVGSTFAHNWASLQFFGEDYSEREWDTEHPRHYIYDHGVEIETLTAFTTDANCIARKDANRLYVSVPATSQKMANFSASLDLTPYDLMRCVVGDAIVGASYMALYSSAPTLPSQTVISEYGMSVGSIDPYQNGIDISSVDQTCYPAFLTYNGSGAVARTSTITEWWLE